MAQTINIKGQVVDTLGLPVFAATVLLDANQGSVSNATGEFIIKNIQEGEHTLTISAMGYATQQLPIHTDTILVLQVVLKTKVQAIETVQISDNRQERLKKSESISFQLIEETFLKEASQATLMQSLAKIPGIQSMDVGTGISKPMVRGLAYYRVVVAKNGIKQEGQQWSNHHGVTFDQKAVDHVEVIKGPASLQYGSGAIGGVINVLPHSVPIQHIVNGEVTFTGKSNTQWYGGSGNVNFRKGDVYADITFTYNSFNDIRIPVTDSFLLPAPVSAAEASHKVKLGNRISNTSGTTSALNLITGTVKNWGNTYLDFSVQRSKIGFFNSATYKANYNKLLDLNTDRTTGFPFQSVRNYAVYHITNWYKGIHKFHVALGYQGNLSEEFDYLLDITGNRKDDLAYYENNGNLDLKLWLQTLTANVTYTQTFNDKKKLIVGFDNQLQRHEVSGYNHILPNYSRSNNGLYVIYKYPISNKLLVNAGSRLDLVCLNIDESLNPDPEYGDSVFNVQLANNYPSVAFSAGANYSPTNSLSFKINLGKSYRVPSVYELAAYGLHRHEGRFEKGNRTNQPEEVWQFDLGYEQVLPNGHFSISPFLNYFTNYLYLNPTAILRREGQVYEYQQVEALMTGGEASIQLRFHGFKITTSGEYVYAVNLDERAAIPFTPPLAVLSGVKYSFRSFSKFLDTSIGIEHAYKAAQNYTVPNELTTPSYQLINVLFQTELVFNKQKLNMMLKVGNLFNEKYFNHISFYRRLRIPEAGRDFQLYLTVPIDFNINHNTL